MRLFVGDVVRVVSGEGRFAAALVSALVFSLLIVLMAPTVALCADTPADAPLAAASAPAAAASDAQDMHRLYNPYSGEHFYTASAEERNALGLVGWVYEGIGWVAPATSATPVYRLYNPYAGDHHYTTSAAERDHLVSVGWNDEGVGWHSDDARRIALWRQYNPTAIAGAHNYTASAAERDFLVSVGWRDEGVGWYALGEGRLATADVARPSTAGALRVRAGRLVGASGEPVQLRGISTHGLAWFPDYVNDACFGQLAREWRANVVRLAMYTAEYGGYCSGGDQSSLKALVRQGIELAAKNDLYVIVDWHILSDNNPLMHTAEAAAFFAEVARDFGSRGNVIYEICNEPNGPTSWSDVKSYAEEVIPAIRAADPDGVVVVGTPTWSQEIDKAAADPLAFDNVMYSLHFYAATHGDDLRNRLVAASRGGLPVFVTEFGICDASGNGAIDEASADQWVSTMNSLGVSYCMWSLCNKAESASALRSDCSKVAGFTQRDLSRSGAWLYRTLTGDLQYANLTDDSGGTPSGGSSDPGTGGGTGGAPSAGWQPSVPAGTSYVVRSGGLAATVTLANSWPDGDRTAYQYSVSIENSGPAVDGWSVRIPFSQGVSLTQAWNAGVAAEPAALTLSNVGYNARIERGASRTDVGLIVTSGAGLAVVR